MRLPRKKNSSETTGPGPEDTQEMFAAGQELTVDPEETREYETADVDVESPADEPQSEEWEDGEEAWDEEPELEEDLEFDEYEDAEVPDPDEAEPAGESPGETEPSPVLVRLASAGDRAKTVASGLLSKIGEIRLPRNEIDGQKVLLGAGILLIALMVGAGGYLLGKGSGDDVDTARLQGEFAGKQAGAIAGATKGYAAGFAKGRDLAFRASYAASYRRNYRRAYENAGMDPPDAKNIEVPKP